jgi:hypothetical protein
VAPILLWSITFLCLLISVLKYLMGLILRASFPRVKIGKDYAWHPAVSVLMPCFNEGRTSLTVLSLRQSSRYFVSAV